MACRYICVIILERLFFQLSSHRLVRQKGLRMENDKNPESSSQPSSALVTELNVCAVSSDPLITDIFRYPFWSVEEGLLYSLGVFKYWSTDGVDKIRTLSNMVYSYTDHKEIIDAFEDRLVRLEAIWKHGHRKEMYRRGYFIRWARNLPDICELSWLKDAENKGLVLPENKKPTTAIDTPLSEDERTSLLKIIAGMASAGYRYPKHGAHKKIFCDLETKGVGVCDNTLRRHLYAAMQHLPPSEAS